MRLRFLMIMFSCCFFSSYAQVKNKWRVNLSGGMGYRTIDTSEDEKKLIDMGFSKQSVNSCYNDLKWGLQGNGDVHYLFHPNFGIGIKYAFFYADGKFDEISSLVIPNSSGYGKFGLYIDEKDYLNYVGPSLHVRSFLEKSKFAVSATFSGGFSRYRSDYEEAVVEARGYFNPSSELALIEHNPTTLSEFVQQFIMRGNSFGMYGSAGLEYFFNKRIALGLDLGYFYSSLNDVTLTTKMDNDVTVSQKVKLTDMSGKKENLSRIDFSLGIKIYL
jgi:hypothetical protein